MLGITDILGLKWSLFSLTTISARNVVNFLGTILPISNRCSLCIFVLRFYNTILPLIEELVLPMAEEGDIVIKGGI
jgi:hypothetical protein